MLKTTDLRSKNYSNQLRWAAFYKFGAVLASFVAMPITVNYLGAELFGVWATMLSIISWVMFFDFGIGNGLKNKLSESLAVGDNRSAAQYISTAYGLVACVSIVLLSISVLIALYIPWQKVFNSLAVDENQLRNAVVALVCLTFLHFWLGLINQVYHGLQKSSSVVFGQFIASALSLILIYLLDLLFRTSIVYMAVVYGISLVFSNALITWIFFRGHIQFRPNYRLFDTFKIRPLFSLSSKFFLLQLAVLIIFLSDRILITQLIGPTEVTPYEVLFKLFGVLTILHVMILSPLWPAYSDAYAKSDFEWIRSQLRKQISISIVFIFSAVALAVVGPIVVKFWLDLKIDIAHRVYAYFALIIVLSTWSNVFAYFVNAIGRLDLQLYSSIFAALINVPLSIVFVKYFEMGLGGILLATVCSLSAYSILGPIEVYRILKRDC